jgi:hypothetical protein
MSIGPRKEAFFARNPRWSPYKSRLLCVVLAQGGALHYLTRSTGVKDLDVWTSGFNLGRKLPGRLTGMTELELENLAEGLCEAVLLSEAALDGKAELPDKAAEALASIVALFRAFDHLVKRVEALEERPIPKYHGAWKAKRMYAEGSFVTSDGSIWHANQSTDTKPGTDNTWTLAVKKGRDGR